MPDKQPAGPILEGFHCLVCKDRKGRQLWKVFLGNMATVEGRTYLLNAGMAGGAQLSNWYLGLIGSEDYVSDSEDDTMSSHEGWDEIATYSESTRPAYTPLSIASGICRNTTPALFTFSSETIIKGVFLASNSTKGGTTGTLLSTAILSVARTFQPGNTLQDYYEMRIRGGN